MTVRAIISERSKKMLQEIVHETGKSQIAVIEHALLTYHRELRIQKVNQAYAKLKQNKRNWKEERIERPILENTAEDGLEDA